MSSRISEIDVEVGRLLEKVRELTKEKEVIEQGLNKEKKEKQSVVYRILVTARANKGGFVNYCDFTHEYGIFSTRQKAEERLKYFPQGRLSHHDAHSKVIAVASEELSDSIFQNMDKPVSYDYSP